MLSARSFVAACAVAALAAPVAAEELKFAHFVSPNHTITSSVVEPLSEGVAADTDGALTIRTYPGGELGAGPLEQYVRALQGVADITFGLQGYTSSQFPKSMIVELPGAVPEGMTGAEMLWRAYDAGEIASEFPGTQPLAIWASEPAVMIMKDHDVRSPADMEGLKIRVAGSTSAEVVESLGGTPVQMPITQVYNALQTGLIDGVFTGSSAILDFKLDEVANSYTVGAPLGRVSFYVVMNKERYDALPEDQRAALDKHSGVELSKSAEQLWGEKGVEAIEMVKGTGDNTVIELTPEEAEAFAAVTLNIRDKVIVDVGGEQAFAVMRGE